MTTGDGPAPSPTVLPQKDGTVSVLPLDGRRLAVPSRPLLLLIEPKVRDCSFRLHTTLPFPTHLGPLDLYLDSHRSIANTHGSPLHHRNSYFGRTGRLRILDYMVQLD